MAIPRTNRVVSLKDQRLAAIHPVGCAQCYGCIGRRVDNRRIQSGAVRKTLKILNRARCQHCNRDVVQCHDSGSVINGIIVKPDAGNRAAQVGDPDGISRETRVRDCRR